VKRYAFTLFALLAACGGGSSAPPASAPTSNVSPSPAPPANAPAASPSSFSFSSGTEQNLTVTESGYTGTFTESDTCNPYSGEIASVVAGAHSAGSATYAVTPVGAGACAIRVTDTAGNATAVNVTVSTAAITVQ
jgi:hypothetical protein